MAAFVGVLDFAFAGAALALDVVAFLLAGCLLAAGEFAFLLGLAGFLAGDFLAAAFFGDEAGLDFADFVALALVGATLALTGEAAGDFTGEFDLVGEEDSVSGCLSGDLLGDKATAAAGSDFFFGDAAFLTGDGAAFLAGELVFLGVADFFGVAAFFAGVAFLTPAVFFAGAGFFAAADFFAVLGAMSGKLIV